MSNTWREVPMETGRTVPPTHKTFVEIDDKGDKTGRIKHVYPGKTAADNDMVYMFVPYGYAEPR